jgi:hypothetical protein
MSIGKVILGLAAAGGAGLTLWKIAEIVGEMKVGGPPVWWILWRKPLPDAVPELDPAFGEYASKVFWFERGKDWEAVTKVKQFKEHPRKSLTQKPASKESIFAEVFWKFDPKSGKWNVCDVGFAGGMKGEPKA